MNNWVRSHPVIALGAVFAALVSATTYAAWPEPDPHSETAPSVPPPGSPLRSPPGSPRAPRATVPYDAEPRLVQRSLANQDIRSLPRLRTPLPETLDVEQARATARPLIADPVDYALAVIQASPERTRRVVTRWSQVRLFVLGNDRRWRWLDAPRLGFTGPVGEGYAFGRNSLSADGTRLAVAQEGRNRLVVADLTTGRIKRLRVPFRDPVFPTWTPDGRSLITQDRYRTPAPAVRVDVATGRVTTFPHNLFAIGFTPEGDLAEIRKSASATAPAQLVEFGPSPTTVDLRLVVRYADRPWISRAVALERQGIDDETLGEIDILVFDRRSGRLLAQLPCQIGDSWIGVQGWLTDDTLLLQRGSTGDLIAWTYPTARLHLVSKGAGIVSNIATSRLRHGPTNTP